MPDSHYVLVAERRGVSTRQRHREIVYATNDLAQAKTDAADLGKRNKRMRYYVMPYRDAYSVASAEVRELERALDEAAKMGR